MTDNVGSLLYSSLSIDSATYYIAAMNSLMIAGLKLLLSHVAF